MRRTVIALRLAAGLSGVIVAALAVIAYRPSLLLPLPDPSQAQGRIAPSSVIVDRHGVVLYEIIDPHAGPNRRVALSDIPAALSQATVSTEDASFYRNPGVDLRAVARAIYYNVRSGQVVSGGSTITQQLVRLLYFSPSDRARRSVWRKAREAALAYSLTRSLSKDGILELYLNEAYYGSMAYGADAASRAYFGKPVGELDLAECALLAGLPQSPATYNPLTDLPAAKARQRTVLNLMVRAGHLSQAQSDLAYREELQFAGGTLPMEAPHFGVLVRQTLEGLVGNEAVRAGGLVVRTTLDAGLQRLAENAVGRHLATLNAPADGRDGHNVHNAAALLLSVPDGAVLAMVGSPDYFDPSIDGALNASLALRQPGSVLKPLTYAAAFERGWSPASVVSDVRTSFLTREGEPYVPQNYDRAYHGPVSLRRALACSYNVVAVRLLDAIGVPSLPDMARRLGVSSLNDPERYGLSLTLGGTEVSLWELTGAYASLASGGLRVAPYTITSVEDGAGRQVIPAPPFDATRVLDERIAYLVTDALADDEARESAFGSGSALVLGYPAAVKTGTTGEWRDNWTVGYTTQYVAGVWVGNADNTPMSDVSGVTGAAPIWNAIMSAAHPSPPPPFHEPAGLVHAEVCPDSGLRPTSACPHRRTEVFLPPNAPQTACSMHRLVTLDAATGDPVTGDTPVERRLVKRLTVWPADAQEWAREAGLATAHVPPTVATRSMNADSRLAVPGRLSAPGDSGALAITSPDPNSSLAITSDIPLQSQRLRVSATSAPTVDAASLVLYVDDRPFYAWSGPPFETWWTLEPGAHRLRVEGRDAVRGKITSSTVQVTVLRETPAERTVP